MIINSQDDLKSYLIQDQPIYYKNKVTEFIKNHKSLIINICSKIFYYFFHLALIAIFETIFYFFYISGEEDNGINDNIISVIKDISYDCKYFSSNIKFTIIDYLKSINDSSYIISREYRLDQNKELFNDAMNYVYVFLCISLVMGIIIVNTVQGRNKIRELFIDTVIIMGILSAYEYNFFLHIIKNYSPITTNELEYYTKNELIFSCSG